jgi:hypothetical protein
MHRTPIAALALTVLAATAGAVVAADGGTPLVKEHKIALVLKIDGDAERLELDDLHDLEVGESRSYTTESGKAVEATRTERGFELDVDGKKITLPEAPEVGAGGDVMMFHKKIEIEGEAGDAKTMVWHGATEPGKVVVMRHDGAPDGFAFHHGEGADFHRLLGAEGWIERLERSAKFQELDEATREKVREALREVAPAAPHAVFIEVDERERGNAPAE